MTPYVLVHYAEIGLKGKNRASFERQLARNMADRLAGLDVEVVRRPGRLLVVLSPGTDPDTVVDRLRTVPGIAYLAPAYVASKDIDAIGRTVLRAVGGRSPASFRVRAHRADKGFPLTSPAINAHIGGLVQDATGWPVDLERPDLEVRIEVLYDNALLYLDRIEGVGGLPVGVSGTVALLLSGGIDSPVAGYYALKRGCYVVPVHFHSGPFGNWLGSELKIRRLVAALRPYGLGASYYVVPIGEIQQQMVVASPPPFRVLLYRRLMVRIAQTLIRSQEGMALVTGESLGQVASQTLHSLHVVEAVADLPILRPLIGFDKVEIIDQAKILGTYDLSVEPGDDCCQFLMPRQVVTRPLLSELEAAEARLDMEALVAAGVNAARLERVA